MTKAISGILEKHMLGWMMIPGVAGAAEGMHRGRPCIVVLVEKKTRSLQGQFPPSIDGVRIVFKEAASVRER